LFVAEVITGASLHSRSSSLDSSTQLSSQQQQQQQAAAAHHSSPTPTDDAPPPTGPCPGDSAVKDPSAMDAAKSTMWLGTEDGW